MTASNFNTKNDTFRKLFGNGLTYRVPPFQRDYSWETDEWEDLWQDILGTLRENGEPSHYMGYLVLQSSDDRRFEIIDGQQRLTTLSILVLAGLRKLQELVVSGQNAEQTQLRLDGLRQAYIGFLDPVTLVSKSKLTLNRNDDRYFQNYLVTLSDKPPARRIKASEHRLRKAYEWFSERVGDYVRTSADPGLAVAQLIDGMSDKLLFTVITVTDELNAYKVFETLNARGVRLSATDLLKNYMFSVLARADEHANELKNLEERWESIVGRLNEEAFPDFLRVHWISRRSLVRQSELFKTIKTRVTGRQEAFALLNALDEDLDNYLALTSPENSNWSPQARSNVQLLKMFSVRQPFALLMAARRKLSEPNFDELLRAIVVISFRYNVIGKLQTSDQESAYSAAALSISNGTLTSLGPVLEALRGVYPSDDAFKASFSQRDIVTTQSRNRRVVKYILARLEAQMGGGELEYLNDSLSVEHILPQNPATIWTGFTDSDAEGSIDRLGNLTLLPAGQNKDLGAKSFAEKRQAYAASPFLVTRKVAEENEDWTPDRMQARQNAMAKMATGIWRIAQLSK